MNGLVVRWRNEWEQAEEELDLTDETRKPAPAAIDTEKKLDLAAATVDDAAIRALPTVALSIAAVICGCVALAFLWLAVAP